jgi:predicted nucleic acid-binding protein
MSGFLFDTNVLLDIATADPVWLAWSESQFRTTAAQGPILINPIIYAELAPAFASACGTPASRCARAGTGRWNCASKLPAARN